MHPVDAAMHALARKQPLRWHGVARRASA